MATPLEKSSSAALDAPKDGEETRTDDHERDEIEFVDPLPEELMCSICLLVFQDPILTDCGHQFCQACIAPVVSKNRNCPLCNEEGFRTFPDKRTGRKIKSLKIKCKKSVEGCEWVGEYGRVEYHLDVKEGDCGFVEVECDFSSIGCTTRSLRKNLPQHMEANTHKHLIMMSIASPKADSEMERQLQEQRAELLQQQLRKKEEETQQQVTDMQQQVTTLKKREEETQRQVTTLKKKEEDTQRRLVKLEGELTEKNEQITTLQGKVKLLEEKVCCPPCEFIMYDFSKHKAADDEWLSPPFYSYLGGYKQRLAVYANGYDQYKGERVSFVLYTMQGEYDDQLQWPRQLYTYICMLNHSTGKWDGDAGCQYGKRAKPMAAQERHTCWHTRTDSDLGPFLKNDCIHFRVTEVRPII